jgi:hypothetical protein
MLWVRTNVSNAAPSAKYTRYPANLSAVLLDRRSRLLSPLNCFYDLTESGVFSKAIGPHVEYAGLVKSAGIDFAARNFFARHGLACDRRLFHKRVAGGHFAIDGNPATRANNDNLSGKNRLRGHFDDLVATQQTRSLRQEIQHVLNRASAAPNS